MESSIAEFLLWLCACELQPTAVQRERLVHGGSGGSGIGNGAGAGAMGLVTGSLVGVVVVVL